jgi:hypothetical protein
MSRSARAYFHLLVALPCVIGLVRPTAAQCMKDIECKGDRICINGRCEDPRRSRETSERAPVPRGALGIVLGMSIQDVGTLFHLSEKSDPVVTLLKKYGVDAEDKEVANRVLQKKVFTLSAREGFLGDGIRSVDAEFIGNSLYQIGIHYGRVYVDRVGWETLVHRYVPRDFWLPASKTSDGWEWADKQTSLSIAYSGELVNVHFTDLPSRQRIEYEEFKAKAERGR